MENGRGSTNSLLNSHPDREEEIDMAWLNRKSPRRLALRGAWTKQVNAKFWRVMGKSRTATFLRIKFRRWRRGSARGGVSIFEKIGR